MRRVLWTLILLLILFLLGLPQVWATPPQLTVNYDLASQVLKIEISHVSNNVREHYVRRLVIYKNDREVKSTTFPRQPMPTGLTEEISLPAQEGDQIKVEAFCKEGGTGQASIVVAQPAEEKNVK